MMPALGSRLKSLKARDVMSRQPITLRENVSLASAVESLQQHEFTGAPVVDQAGRLVGMLSLWDVVRTKGEPANRAGSADAATVGQRMSRNVGTVKDDQPLVDVARLMCDKHWHRVPVVAADGQLLGIISTMDVLAALVNVFEEFA